MSDIGGIISPLDLAVIALMIGAPGAILGVLAGALLWRNRRWLSACVGAVSGLVLWLAGWMVYVEVV